MGLKITEKIVQYNLYQRYNLNHKIFATNYYLYFGECDFLTIDKNSLIHEFEIKLDYYDYKADFKKEEKHKEFKLATTSTPNFFNYVCPEGMIKKEETPSYAGLIYFKVSDRNWGEGLPVLNFKVIKNRVVLHDYPIESGVKDRIMLSMMYKTWNLKKKEFALKTCIKGLRDNK